MPLSGPPNNLPQQLTSFIGREHEIAGIKGLLETDRLVTLTGTAGCGKTRLGLQVATELLPAYPGGVWLVELAMLADPELVPQYLASILGITEVPGRPVIDSICEYLQSLTLLVFDNCEHLILACASVAYTLLLACPSLHILATSRECLQILGETIWPVPALTSPDAPSMADDSLSLESLGRYEAVQLFTERARARCSEFSVTQENARSVVEICHHLDGLPLAIELAAARVQVLAVEQIAVRLSERFRLLTSADPIAPLRQQTLTALMNWSYDLLSCPEQSLLRKLAVFAGSFNLEAAEAICCGEPGDGREIDEYELIDLLAHLANKSLLTVEVAKGEARYRLLETVRQYAWNKLAELGEAPEACNRHRDWYLAFAEQSKAKLAGDEQLVYLDRLEVEHDNLRMALDRSIKEQGNVEVALRLSSSLWRFWDLRGHIGEGRKWLSDALSLPSIGSASSQVRAKALNAAGNLAAEQNDLGQASVLYEQALAIRRELGDKQGIAGSLANLGVVARRNENYDKAAQMYEESLALLGELEDLWGMASVLDNLALVKQNQGDYHRADELYGESALLFSRAGDKQGLGMALNNRAKLAEYLGNHNQAVTLYKEALTLASGIGDKLGIIGPLNGLASMSNKEGDHAQAASLYRKSLTLSKQLGNKQDIANALEGLAVSFAYRQPDWAAQLFGAAEIARQQVGNAFMPHVKRADYEKCRAAVRSRLGGKVYDAAWAVGRTLSLDEAIAVPPDSKQQVGLAASPQSGMPTRNGYSTLLSNRELEVLCLVATGMTDSQVAEQLSISARTVHAHLGSLYRKLGIHGRSSAIRFAVDNHIA